MALDLLNITFQISDGTTIAQVLYQDTTKERLLLKSRDRFHLENWLWAADIVHIEDLGSFSGAELTSGAYRSFLITDAQRLSFVWYRCLNLAIRWYWCHQITVTSP